MKPVNPPSGLNRRVLLSTLAVLPVLRPLTTAAQPAKQGDGSAFSFAVYGDSRSMMYLPYKKDQETEARKLMVDLFALVLPEKASEALVNKNVKLIYDPATKELVQVVMPFMTKSEVTTLTLDKGWVTEASVEDVKLLPGGTPHDVPSARRRVGRPRDREGCPERTSKVRSQYRGHGLVRQAGWHAVREPVLEAGL